VSANPRADGLSAYIPHSEVASIFCLREADKFSLRIIREAIAIIDRIAFLIVRRVI